MTIPMHDGQPNELLEQLVRCGFIVVRNAISTLQIEELKTLCAAASTNSSVARRGDSVYGIRNLLTNVIGLREIVSGSPYINLVETVLGQSARPVYGVFFDKTADANWPIPWHQDITIRVRQRRDLPGFEPRPVKDGVVHLLPPVELSEQMLTLRIHLDDASSTHGALRVIPGSHLHGRLSNDRLQQQVATTPAQTCDVGAAMSC